MFESTFIVALAGFLTSHGLGTPLWHADYGTAQTLGMFESKPLAVFIGSGEEGWNQIHRDGRLGKEIRELLADTYICVYADTSRDDGKLLAAELQIPDAPGLVVSDHTGAYQAFRHQGDLSSDQLLRYLQRYADPDRVVRTTETNPVERRSYYYRPMGSLPVSRGC